MLDTAKLKRLREKKGMTQGQAGTAAELSRSDAFARQRWNAIESGREANLTLDTLGRVAKALGVKAKDLLE